MYLCTSRVRIMNVKLQKVSTLTFCFASLIFLKQKLQQQATYEPTYNMYTFRIEMLCTNCTISLYTVFG